MKQGVRTVAQMKRFSQLGRWEGWIEVDEVLCGDHRLTFAKSSRIIERAEIDTRYRDGRRETFVLESVLRYHMIGTDYNHSEWGHSFCKGEEADTLACWDVETLNLNAPSYLHVQHVVRATCGDGSGWARSSSISPAPMRATA